jgi:HPt (histidine-containing phosphotransfer) domain-containing protein
VLPAHQGLLDLAVLAAISGGHQDAQRQVLAEFRRSNEADIAAMRSSARDGAFDALAHHAHRLRGACGVLGAARLAEAAVDVHDGATHGDSEHVDVAMEEVERELQRLDAYLDGIESARPEGGAGQ